MLVHLFGVRFFVHRGVARWIGVPYVLQVTCSSRDWEDSYPVVLAVKDRATIIGSVVRSASCGIRATRFITASLMEMEYCCVRRGQIRSAAATMQEGGATGRRSIEGRRRRPDSFGVATRHAAGPRG